jgi:hypothetical protein
MIGKGKTPSTSQAKDTVVIMARYEEFDSAETRIAQRMK